jgi:hypothetical protein
VPKRGRPAWPRLVPALAYSVSSAKRPVNSAQKGGARQEKNKKKTRKNKKKRKTRRFDLDAHGGHLVRVWSGGKLSESPRNARCCRGCGRLGKKGPGIPGSCRANRTLSLDSACARFRKSRAASSEIADALNRALRYDSRARAYVETLPEKVDSSAWKRINRTKTAGPIL